MRSLCSSCDGIGWMCRDAEGALHKYDAPGVTGTAVACKCQSLARGKRASDGEKTAARRRGKKPAKPHRQPPPTAPDRKTLSAGN